MNLSTDNIVTIIGYLISAYAGYTVSKSSSKNTLKIESLKIQLYNVYLPLFKEIENNLYKNISIENATALIEIFQKIKDNNYEYVDSYLSSLFVDLEKHIDNDFSRNFSFSSICYTVDKNYEKLKKFFHLPQRSFLYKFGHKQLPKDTVNFIKYLFNVAKKLFYAFMLIGIPIYCGIFAYRVILLIQSLFNH